MKRAIPKPFKQCLGETVWVHQLIENLLAEITRQHSKSRILTDILQTFSGVKQQGDIPYGEGKTHMSTDRTTLQTLATQSSMSDGHRPGPFPCPLRETSELLRGSVSSSHLKLLVFENPVGVWRESPSSTNWLLFLEQTPPMVRANWKCHSCVGLKGAMRPHNSGSEWLAAASRQPFAGVCFS
jgi:hypothetical protein